VTLLGEKGAVLKKFPSIESAVTDFLGYGFYEFKVAEPDKFRLGMGVLLHDKKAGGFYDTVATIIGRHGDAFFINRILNHDYLPYDGGTVSTVYPLVEGVGVTNARVEGLTLDGNREETRYINGCRGGGVFLLQSHNITLRKIEVHDFKGDSLSFQQCTDITIQGCHLHHNFGAGLHPGSGSVRYHFQENDVHENTGCGIFYCLRTTHSLCERNRFSHNDQHGISIGERDTDHWIRDNVISENGLEGIRFRTPIAQGGDRVRIEGNRLDRNCRLEAGSEIYVAERLRDVYLVRNAILPAHGPALRVDADAKNIHFAANRIMDRPQTPTDMHDATRSVQTTMPADLPEYGANPNPATDFQHLHWKPS
jgi:hypothetical protein